MKWRLGLFLLAAATALAPAASDAGGGTRSQDEDDVKAAYLYNFCKFIEWPEDVLSDDAEFIEIGVLGDDSFAELLEERIRSKTAQGRSFLVKEASDPSELAGCHMVYLGEAALEFLPDQLADFVGKPVVTIGLAEDFSETGGIIELVREDKRLRFEINIGAAHRGGMEISSQVLKLARAVHRETEVDTD